MTQRVLAAHELAAHINDLARAFNIGLHLRPELHPAAAGSGVLRSDPTRRAVVAAPVTCERTYAIVLHELGHCLAPNGMIERSEFSATFQATRGQVFGTLRDITLQLEEERNAWEWARRHALVWTPDMQEVQDFGLASYEGLAARYFGNVARVPGIVVCRTCGTKNRLPTHSATVRCGRCKEGL